MIIYFNTNTNKPIFIEAKNAVKPIFISKQFISLNPPIVFHEKRKQILHSNLDTSDEQVFQVSYYKATYVNQSLDRLLRLYIGCSRWSYTSWQGPFYPPSKENKAKATWIKD